MHHICYHYYYYYYFYPRLYRSLPGFKNKKLKTNIIIIIFFLTPVLNSQGMKKLRYAIHIIIIIFKIIIIIDPRG